MNASIEEIKMNASIEEIKIEEVKIEKIKNEEVKIGEVKIEEVKIEEIKNEEIKETVNSENENKETAKEILKSENKELDEVEIEIEKMKIDYLSNKEEKVGVLVNVKLNKDQTTIIFGVLPISDSEKCSKVLSYIEKLKKYEADKEKRTIVEKKKIIVKKKIIKVLKSIFVDVEIDESMDIFQIMDMLSNGKTIEFRGKWDYYGDRVKFLPYLEESFENLRNYSIGKMIKSINCVSSEKGSRINKYAINFSNGDTKHFSFFDGEPFSDYTGWIEFYDPYSLITKKLLDESNITQNQLNIGMGLPGSGKTEFGKKFKGVVIDDVQLDNKTVNAIINALKNGNQVYVCNSLFCDTRYLEYFLSCIGIVKTRLIKFIFFVPNPYQSSLNIKKRETNNDKTRALLVSLKKLSLIYTLTEMHNIKDKYSYNNYCFIRTYEPPQKVEVQTDTATIQKSTIALNKKIFQDEYDANNKPSIQYSPIFSINVQPRIDWSLLSKNQW